MAERAPVVVGVDGSPFGDEALRWAVEDGRLRGAEVVALLAWDYLHQLPVPGGPDFDPDYRQDVATAALEALVRRVLGADGAAVRPRAVFGLAAPVLLEEARGASLLVVGARGLGRLRGLLLGSVSQRCAHLCPVPLAVVRNTPIPRGDVVVGVDGTDTSAAALAWAADEARRRRCRLQVLTSTGDRSGGLEAAALARLPASRALEGRQLLDHMIAEAPNVADLDLQSAVVSYGPARALVDASSTAQLLVVGNPGHSSFGAALIGSVSQQVVHHAQCPTVLVPQTGR